MSWSDRVPSPRLRAPALGLALARRSAAASRRCMASLRRQPRRRVAGHRGRPDPGPARPLSQRRAASPTSTAPGRARPPKYRLTVVTEGARADRARRHRDAQRAQAATVVIDTDYRADAVGGGTPIASGTVTSAATYDRSEQRFANIRAARDAEIRDAKTSPTRSPPRSPPSWRGVPAALSRPHAHAHGAVPVPRRHLPGGGRPSPTRWTAMSNCRRATGAASDRRPASPSRPSPSWRARTTRRPATRARRATSTAAGAAPPLRRRRAAPSPTSPWAPWSTRPASGRPTTSSSPPRRPVRHHRRPPPLRRTRLTAVAASSAPQGCDTDRAGQPPGGPARWQADVRHVASKDRSRAMSSSAKKTDPKLWDRSRRR